MQDGSSALAPTLLPGVRAKLIAQCGRLMPECERMSPLRLLETSISDPVRELVRRLDIEALYARAGVARERAYARYSKFGVGAALLTKDDNIVTAGNVENASYGLTICAERAAVVRAVAEGHRNFAAIAVAASDDRTQSLVPCGACLQVLSEFDPDKKLVVIFPEDDLLRVALLSELLPVRFGMPG